MLPKRLLQLQTKNLHESSTIICNVVASSKPGSKTIGIELPDIMGFKNPTP